MAGCGSSLLRRVVVGREWAGFGAEFGPQWLSACAIRKVVKSRASWLLGLRSVDRCSSVQGRALESRAMVGVICVMVRNRVRFWRSMHVIPCGD